MNGLILRCTFDGVRYDLDTYEDIPFRVDVSAIQNNQIGNVFGVASQTITLPGSQRNNAFFQAAFNVNSPFARGFKRSVECQVLQNGVEVFKGNLILNDVVSDGDADTVYNTTIVNESVDFATLIQDQYISTLDWTDYEHEYSITNITASWYDTASFFGGDIYYPLAAYGTDGTDPNINPIEFGGTVGKVDNSTTPIRLQQFKPAIRAKVIVDKIFESVGYQYSSSFFDSSDFNRIYVLTTADDKLGIVSQQSQDAGFLANKTANQAFVGPTAYAKLTFPSETYDPGAQWSTGTSTLTISNAGTYAFQASLPFTKSTISDKTAFVVVELHKNGVLLADQTYNLKTMATGTMNFATAGFPLASGDTIELYLSWDGEDNGLSGTTLTIQSTATFGTIYAPAVVVGGTVDIGGQFDPSIKSLDFLKGLIEKFNLVLEPKKNQRNTIIVEPFDVWTDAGVVKDWSDKYDRATKISVKHPIASQPLKLSFQDGFDQDTLTEYSKNNFDAENPYGTYNYVANSDVAQGERKVGGFFGPLPAKGVSGAPGIIIPQLHRIESGDKKSFKFKPRLGYRIDNQVAVGATAGVFYMYNPETTTAEPFNTYSTISHLKEYPATADTPSLHFNANTWYPFHQNYVDGYTINGAFNTYWGRYINELYDDSSRILTLNMKFNPIELKDIQLNDKIFIDNAYYRINKINGFNITDRDNVQVELLKAPVRKFKYPKSRVYTIDYPLGYDVNADVFNPRGDVVVVNDTGSVVTDKDILQDFAVQTGLRFISGSVYWKWDYNPYLNATSEQAVRGSTTVDASAGAVIGAADDSIIGQNVDKGVIIGTGLVVERDVKNVYIGGGNIQIGSGSVDVAVFSSKDSVVGPDTLFGTMLGVSGSFVNGSLNTIVGSQDSKIYNNARQTTLIGGKQIYMDGNLNSLQRHTHIGGDASQYYITSSGEHFVNSVGLGQLPNVPVAPGVDKEDKVIIGDSIYAGGVWLKTNSITCSDGGSYNMVGDHDSFFTLATWTGGNGNFYVFLPNAAENIGRWLQFSTDDTFDNSATKLWLTPYTSQNINGVTGDGIYTTKEYNGLSIISIGTGWIVLGGEYGS